MKKNLTHLRPFNPDTDFPRLQALVGAFDPDPWDLAQVRSWWERMPPGRVRRWIAAADEQDEMVGFCEATHETWHPARRFYLWLTVDRPWRGQGIGSALFADAQAFLYSQEVTSLESEVRDHDPASLHFAQQRHFTVHRHRFESLLDLEAFDESPFLPAIKGLEADGLCIFSLADLYDTRPARRRLYELNRVTALDIPGEEEDWMSFEDFEQVICSSSWYRPEGQLIAAFGDEWAGLSAVKLIPESQVAYNLMTGVLAPYRGRKIAQALKLAAIRYARQSGARYIRTHNDSLNAPMLAINRKLGYQPRPGKLVLRASFPPG